MLKLSFKKEMDLIEISNGFAQFTKTNLQLLLIIFAASLHVPVLPDEELPGESLYAVKHGLALLQKLINNLDEQVSEVEKW